MTTTERIKALAKRYPHTNLNVWLEIEREAGSEPQDIKFFHAFLDALDGAEKWLPLKLDGGVNNPHLLFELFTRGYIYEAAEKS